MLLIVATLGAIGVALFRRRPQWLARVLRRTSASRPRAVRPGPALALTAPANSTEAAR